MNKNKEAKSSAPAWGSRILLRKTRRLNPLLLQGQSHFASQNKEAKSSAPARAVAFCFAKQGGFYDF
jgi:hypothetical protein